VKRATPALLLVLVTAFAGCEPDPAVGRTLSIDARSPAACPVAASATLELEALGDFEASNRTAELVSAAASNRELTFPLTTRAVSAVARDGSERWLGVAQVFGDAAQLALLPEDRGCSLFAAEPGAYPANLAGQSAGLSSDGRVLLVAGGKDSDAADTLLFDLGTLASGRAASSLSDFRSWASVTPVGAGFLVAGGESASEVLGDADIVGATISARPPQTIGLFQERARHAGVVLSTGETLLVAGDGGSGTPLNTLEVISPVPPYDHRLAGLAVLAVGRINPVAIRLTNGRVLVGGGEDALGTISSVEWLTPDASRAARPPVDLAAFGAVGGRLALTALPGGGALAAAHASSTAPSNVEAVAFWISPEGLVEPFNVSGPARDSEWDPLLIPGTDASPFLVTGPPGAQRVLRFNPWERSSQPFQPSSLDPTVPLPDATSPGPIALDAGAFAWLAKADDQINLFGLRHGVRGAYARDVALLTPDPEDPLRPLHLAPDWRLGPDTLAYDGKLRLGGDGSAPTQRLASVFVTDALYADFDLTVDVEAGPPPLVLVGDAELGGPGCAWPEPGAAPEQLRVLRRGRNVLLLRGGSQRPCEVADRRLPIGLKQGGVEPSVVTGLTIRRAILPE